MVWVGVDDCYDCVMHVVVVGVFAVDIDDGAGVGIGDAAGGVVVSVVVGVGDDIDVTGAVVRCFVWGCWCCG